MCAIFGYVLLKDNIGSKPDLHTLKRMGEILSHRGPDGEGFFMTDFAGVGFKRLSIVGLENGNQPIFNENKEICIVCNGEIFNYRELREQMSQRGHIFKTDSDCEVLVHLYEEYGFDFLDRLNGQFALVIIDISKKLVFGARDQFGIIPLYYTVVNDCILFSSEIKGLLVNDMVEKRVDLTGFDQFLSLPHLVSPRTMFENVKSLSPGHAMLADTQSGKSNVFKYWDVEYPMFDEEYPELSEDYYVEKLDILLNKSINYRSKADVEVGGFLSGGLDSSLISCILGGNSPGKKLFSIAFNQKGFSETEYQQMVVDKIQASHFKALFNTSDIAQRLERVIYHSEAPVKETYNTATLKLSELARKNGIKVILTGEGADELFAGYPSYRFDKFRKLRGNENISEQEKNLRYKVWGDADFKYEHDLVNLVNWKKSLLSDDLISSFDKFDFMNHEVVSHNMIAGRDPIHQRSYIDLKVRLADHLLSDHSDRMLMANSVEGRFPFLDIDLVKFLSKVPPEYKLKDFTEKYILKKLAHKYIPKEIINREKFIFIAPGSTYLLRENYDMISDLLSYETIKRQGYFNPDRVELLKKKYLSKDFQINTSIDIDEMIMVITFNLFLKVFNMPNL